MSNVDRCTKFGQDFLKALQIDILSIGRTLTLNFPIWKKERRGEQIRADYGTQIV